ncbi:MAG: toxin [Polaromonas sp.]|nr:toxin [Polaromonas sp.]
MTDKARLSSAIDVIISKQQDSGKPLAIVLAGHNGSGKSTLWYEHLANKLQIPLINADRMMLSILPDTPLPGWAITLRDKDEAWMGVAQKGVQSFVAQAMAQGVPFATETVFSYWQENPDGTVSSKLETIQELQKAGYFVLLIFVGLGNVSLSMARVSSRKAGGGHNVEVKKLKQRFPRTQKAIRMALPLTDAAILADNSLDLKRAFSVVRIQMGGDVIFDTRTGHTPSPLIKEWMEAVCGPAA